MSAKVRRPYTWEISYGFSCKWTRFKERYRMYVLNYSEPDLITYIADLCKERNISIEEIEALRG